MEIPKLVEKEIAVATLKEDRLLLSFTDGSRARVLIRVKVKNREETTHLCVFYQEGPTHNAEELVS